MHLFESGSIKRLQNVTQRVQGWREVKFPVVYKNNLIGNCVADFVVENSVIVELKALDGPLQPAHFGQCLNYMRVSDLKVGLIINFGRPKLEWRRLSR